MGMATWVDPLAESTGYEQKVDDLPEPNFEVIEKMSDVDDIKELLAYTEPITTQSVTLDGTDGIVVFSLPSGWNIGLKEKDGQDITEAEIGVGSDSFHLTKDAALSFTGAIGLPANYVYKTPGVMIQSHLNYWAGHSPDVQIKMLLKEDTVLATTKNGITPFSNLELLDAVVDRLNEKDFDSNTYRFDWKSHHDLHITSLRLLASDTVEVGGSAWRTGLEIRNSLTGSKPLSVRGYMFNESTGGGAVTMHGASKYNRKIMGQNKADVMEWLGLSVDNVTEVFSHELEALEAIVDADMGSTNKVLADIFRMYKVPLRVRTDIIDHFEAAGDETFYGVMQSVMESCNKHGLPEHFVTTLLEIAGDIMRTASDRCGACKRVIV